jgi:protein TonB
MARATPGAGYGEPGAEYGPYLAAIRWRVQEALRYPLTARRRGLAGTVHLEILIGQDGAVGGAAVAVSSSHAVLDAAALEAVRMLPAQPFPAGLPPRPLRVRLPVTFRLE